MTRSNDTTSPRVQGFFHGPTNTITYLVSDPATGAAAIIDPVLDYDPAAARTDDASIVQVLDAVRDQGLDLKLILDTHAHADHLSGADEIRQRTGAPIGIGGHITKVQKVFGALFEAHDVTPDGVVFDRLFTDGERFTLGSLEVEVLHTPGHTPACVSYHIGDAVFVGDTLFMPDFGTARADFPGGDARTLYRSIHKLLALPEATRMFVGHDYLPEGRDGLSLGDHGGRPEGGQHPCGRRRERGRFRGHARGPRRDVGGPQADPAVPADEHPRRRPAARGAVGEAVSEDAVERDLRPSL